MNPLPIVHRELMLLSRRRWFYWSRTGIGAAMALAACIVLATTWIAAPQQSLGAPLFATATAITFLVCVLSGPVLLSDCIAEERSAGTLGLLFLTHSTSLDVVGGKFTALALPAVHCLLAAVPVMGLSFVLGGVTGAEFFRTALALVNALFFSLAATLLCSAMLRSGRTAFGCSLLIVLACYVALPALILLNPKSGWCQSWFLQAGASPALALWHARDGMLAAVPTAFTSALMTTHALGWLFLGLSVLGLKRSWREDRHAPSQSSRSGRESRLPFKMSGDAITQLARRRLGGRSAAWGLTGATALGIVLALQATRAGLISEIQVILVAYVLHGVFKIWVGWVASRAFAAERDCGALELLLVTPLGETAIWRAWLSGLRNRFLLPALSLAGFDLLVAWWISTDPSSGNAELAIYFLTVLAGGVFLLDCYALSWIGLWSGLIARNGTRACIRTLFIALVVPGAAFSNVLFALAITGTLNLNSLMMLVPAWFVISLLLDVLLASLAMVKLSHDCREAVVSAAR
jgi:hypothetical protein